MIDVVDRHALLHLTHDLEHKWIAVVIAIHTLPQVHFLLRFILVVGLLCGDYGVERGQLNVVEQVVSLVGALEGRFDELQSLHLK